MTAKERADGLIDMYVSTPKLFTPLDVEDAAECAIILVNEILDEWDKEQGRKAKQTYWRLVKQELEKYTN